METYLELEELWETVKPIPNADGTLPAVDERKCRRARAKIILLLDPINYIHVKNAKTAREVWAKLEAAFEDTGLTRRVGLLRKLITTTLSSCETVERYVTEIISTSHNLRGVGFDISEEWIGSLLLAGLPEKYKPMIMALENSGTPITGDCIKTKLLQEVQFFQDKTAFVGRKSFPSKPKQGVTENRSAEQPRGPKCKRCHRYGHIARECQVKNETKKGSAFSTVLTTNENHSNDCWVFDSGASDHFTKDRSLLHEEQPASGVVMAADKQMMKIVATGVVKLSAKCCPESPPIDVNGVKFIPTMSNNLLSVSQIVRRGHEVHFSNEGVKVIDPDGELIATGIHDVKHGLFRFEESDKQKALSLASTSADLNVWHRRLGHLNIHNLKLLKNGLVTGMQFKESKMENCSVCAMGKQTRLPFPKSGNRASGVLELVHTDICGPMEEKSIGGSRYYVTFVDDWTRRIFVFFLETKSEAEVLHAFDQFRALAEKQTGFKLKALRSDNGKEYTNRSFQKRLIDAGIVHQTSTEYTPEQNGLAERVNRTIVERARCMLFEAKLPKPFWAEAVAAATYVINRSPTKGHKLTPEEAWSGRKPDMSHVRVFGTKTMSHIPKQKRKKWDVKSKECILVGFDEQSKAYRLYDPVKKNVFKSRDVIFLNELIQADAQTPATNSDQLQTRNFVSLDFLGQLQDDVPETRPEAPNEPDDEEPSDHEPTNEESEESSHSEEDFFSQAETSAGELSDDAVGDVTISALPSRQSSYPPESQVLRRSGRERAIPGKYHDFIFKNKNFPFHNSPVQHDKAGPNSVQQGLAVSKRHTTIKTSDPETPAEALHSAEAFQWKAAMDEEYRALLENETWELVQLPPGKRAIGSKWLFKTKQDEKGNVVRHKARIVAQGFTQKYGTDYDEIFAPVAKQTTFRVLLSVASRRRSIVKHVDVKTAYLNGILEDTVYMRQPEGYTTGNERTVCRLRRSLYGLKQSARVWNRKVDSVFKDLNFQPTKSDPCLYVQRKNGVFSYILIYVDDMIIVTQTEKEFGDIFKSLQIHFNVTNLGHVCYFLGMEIERNASGFKINQTTYIRKLAQRFGLDKAKPSKVPLDISYLQQKEERDQLPGNHNYLSLIGGLLYVAVHSRPDIAVSVSILAQKSSCPNTQDWTEAKRIMRYLNATSNHKLQIGTSTNGLEMFVDADWAGDSRDRKSNSGILIMFGGGPIAWVSRKQTCVALSSTEAEFVALAEGCQELVWIKRLVKEIGEDIECPITIFEDNQSCIKLVEGDRIERRSKHIDTKFFFVRDLQKKGIIRMEYCPTESMLADVLTKPLQRIRLEKLRYDLGIRPDLIEEEC